MATLTQNKIRIRLKAYDASAIEQAAREIVETATRTATWPPITAWLCPHSGQGFFRPCTLAASLPGGAGGRLDGTRTHGWSH